MQSTEDGGAFMKIIKKKVLECIDGDNISVLKLCNLCEAIYPIYSNVFGKGFISNYLMKDLQTSSEKVLKAIEKVPEETKYVSMLYEYNIKKYESIEKLKKDLSNGIVSFLWMKRSIEFIVTFLEKCYITNYSSDVKSCATEAYNEVLKKYHGCITSKFVKLVLNLTPSREKLTKGLGLSSEEEAKRVIAQCIFVAKPMINDISKTIELHNCNFPDKI
ncbi:glycolipid transfer protein, putative [Hepatocystis sp. ex Piliocolobus tephrosceles]|nr:glycolipid transfer protein, putative [Hepatocystis sp. ex Piliocolobus tephrosceles]